MLKQYRECYCNQSHKTDRQP